MKKILVVGNFETFMEMDKNVLSRDDSLMLAASSAESAIDIHKKEHADLIITDLELPGMDGCELSEYIRSYMTLKKVSILILCSDDEEEVKRCKDCGANDYISRPLRADELNRKVSELLDIAERESMRVLMKVTVEGQVEDETFFAMSEDISNSGILIRTEKVLKEGDRMSFSFLLGADQVTIDGEIARVREEESDGYLYGVQFVDMDPVMIHRVEEFIRSRQS
jgi:CheY-like chemotaxis protein